MNIREKGGIYRFLKADMYPPRAKSKGIRPAVTCSDRIKQHRHAFVVTEANQDYCTGFMLTTSSTEEYADNEILDAKYFSKNSDFQSHKNGSYFLTVPLTKMHELETTHVGTITQEGVEYIKSRQKGLPVTWEEYVRATCPEDGSLID